MIGAARSPDWTVTSNQLTIDGTKPSMALKTKPELDQRPVEGAEDRRDVGELGGAWEKACCSILNLDLDSG